MVSHCPIYHDNCIDSPFSTETAHPPTFTIRGEGNPGPFVVVAVDPDAPTPQSPTLAQIRHFLGGSFVPNASTFVLSNSTAAVSEWLQPAPPAGSDPHRYFHNNTLLLLVTNLIGRFLGTFSSCSTNLLGLRVRRWSITLHPSHHLTSVRLPRRQILERQSVGRLCSSLLLPLPLPVPVLRRAKLYPDVFGIRLSSPS